MKFNLYFLNLLVFAMAGCQLQASQKELVVATNPHWEKRTDIGNPRPPYHVRSLEALAGRVVNRHNLPHGDLPTAVKKFLSELEDGDYRTLTAAIEQADQSLVGAYLKNKVKFHSFAEKRRISPLRAAVVKDLPGVVDAFLQEGADPNELTGQSNAETLEAYLKGLPYTGHVDLKETALLDAVSVLNVSAVRSLLVYKAQVTVEGQFFQPLDRAMCYRKNVAFNVSASQKNQEIIALMQRSVAGLPLDDEINHKGGYFASCLLQ